MYFNDSIFNSQQQLVMLIFYIFVSYFFLLTRSRTFVCPTVFGWIALYSTVVIHSNILMLICSKFCSNTSEINQFQIINYSFLLILIRSLTLSLPLSRAMHLAFIRCHYIIYFIKFCSCWLFCMPLSFHNIQFIFTFCRTIFLFLFPFPLKSLLFFLLLKGYVHMYYTIHVKHGFQFSIWS